MTDEQTVISVNNVSKTFVIPHERRDTLKEHFTHFWRRLRYDDFQALQGIDLQVHDGDFLGIIGHNGSGKSTLLKILAGIYQPTKGKVKTVGTISPFLELGVGFNADLTGRENVYLNGTILGLSKQELDEKYDAIVDFAELHDFMDTKIKNYSSGMHVRLAFSIAIQADADIFLCDEVLAVGDLAFQKKCFDVFYRLKNEGKTIIYVSHDIASVRRFCNRCVLLDHGNIVAEGEPNEVIDQYIYAGGEKDAAAAAIAHQPEDAEDKAHFSNQCARIDEYQLIDKNGSPSMTFCPGDPLTIRVKFTTLDPSITEMNAGIAIYDEDGRHLFGDTAAFHDIMFPAQKHSYDIEIPSLPVLEGRYFVTLALNNRSLDEQYDWHHKKISFVVSNNTIQRGIIDFGTQWK